MKVFNYIFILFIRIYKLLISPFVGANCRYQPTCSTYCIESLEKYNIQGDLYLYPYFHVILTLDQDKI